MNWTDVIGVLPPLWMVVAALAILVLGERATHGPNPRPPLLALAGTLVAVFTVWLQWPVEVPESTFAGAVRLDNLSLFVAGAVTLCTAATVLLSIDYLKRAGHNAAEFYALVLFAASGMMMMGSALDLVTLLVGLEIMSVSLYILAGFFRDKEKSIEASVKYFLTGSFATGLYLFGAGLIYGATGSLELSALGQELTSGDASLAKLGTGFLVTAFAFKVAAVPFHMWLPDVYEGSPTTVTGFMAAGVKVGAFAAMIRVFREVHAIDAESLRSALWWIAFLTMLVGNVAALAQNSIKRMLAYSSIAHAGYLLVGIVVMTACSIDGTDAGGTAVRGILYYLMAYSVTTLGAFGIVSFLEHQCNESLTFDDLAGLRVRFPLLSFAFAVFMLSMAGIPGTAGFLGKFLVFESAVQAGSSLGDDSFVMLAILGIVNSLVGLYYYLRVPIQLYAKPMPEHVQRIAKLPTGAIFMPLILLAAVLTLWLGLGPAVFGIGVEPALQIVQGALESLR